MLPWRARPHEPLHLEEAVDLTSTDSTHSDSVRGSAVVTSSSSSSCCRSSGMSAPDASNSNTKNGHRKKPKPKAMGGKNGSHGNNTQNSTDHDADGPPHPQLGTFRGAFLPSLQSILGVILFLRLTHITSQAGCICTTVLLLASTASTLLTWSSLSAIVSNGSIQSGGPYYVISRTLGADVGASLGLLYYAGNTLSGSMFVLGIVEAVHCSVRAYYAKWGYGFSGHLFLYDAQILSLAIVAAMTTCVHFGNRYVVVFSHLFLIVTVLSIVCVLAGATAFALGVYDGNLQPYDRSPMENLWPRFEPDPFTGVAPDIFSSLALIYPSVTGILNGMSKSHQLKHPSRSIPRGTFWSIVTSTGIYLAVCWIVGTTVSNRTLKVDKFVAASVAYPHELIVRAGVVVSALGLVLGCMSTAPKLLSAMADDEVLPCLNFLRESAEDDGYRGYDRSDRTAPAPAQRSLWLTALLVALPTLTGNLDRVSPYATIFYLLTYAGVNASACLSGYVRPPGFRPTFRYFHWSVGLVGVVWCVGLSCLISGVGTVCSLLAFGLLHAYVKKSRRLAATGVRWGTLGNAVRYNVVASALNQLAKHAATTTDMMTATTRNTNTNRKEWDTMDGRAEEGSTTTATSAAGGKRRKWHSSSPDAAAYDDDDDDDASLRDEWIHFHSPTDFHAKNWRPQIMTLVDVDSDGTPRNLHILSLAAQLQQTGRGINAVVSIVDRSASVQAARVAAAVDGICSCSGERGATKTENETNSQEKEEDDSVISELTNTNERWMNEDEGVSLSLASSSAIAGIDHLDTIKLIRRCKALLMIHMKKEGMDGFAEVSSTDGKLYEAVWSAVIHTGLGPVSPNSILLSLPSFLDWNRGYPLGNDSEKGADNSGVKRSSVVRKHDRAKAENYLRTIHGILNLGKAVIIFKGSPSYPKNNIRETKLTQRGTIDIWWIVHDGGLLLLLPFLLSKHAAWSYQQQHPAESNTKKRPFRRKPKPEGAILRLFAVTTTTREHPERLREAVRDHLERVRIQAEVVVVDCLAGTNIAEYMRDPRESVASKGMGRGRRRIGTRRGVDRLGSLREDGISTHHMTLGEVFFPAELSSSFDGERGDDKEKFLNEVDDNGADGRTSDITEDGIDENLRLASILNDAMRKHSGNSNLVVTNLPNIPRDQNAENYFDFVATICHGIDNVMMVRGSGAEVITAYA